VYFRRESGERLCLQCLEKSLIKQVKREISKWKMLNPKDKIGFLFFEEFPLISTASFKLLEKIEKNYPSKLYVLIPSTLKLKEEVLEKVEEKLIFNYPRSNDFLKNFRVKREYALMEALKVGIEKIVLPITLDFEVTYFMYGFLEFNLETIGETMPKLYVPKYNIYFIKPFRKIKTKELTIYGFYKGLFDSVYSLESEAFFNKMFCAAMQYIEKLYCGHFELVDSILKISEILVEKLLKEYGFSGHCSLCGTPVKNDLCSVHKIREN